MAKTSYAHIRNDSAGSEKSLTAAAGRTQEDDGYVPHAVSRFPPSPTPVSSMHNQQQPAWVNSRSNTSRTFISRHAKPIIAASAIILVLGLSLVATTSEVQNSNFAKGLSESVHNLKVQAFADDSSSSTYSRCNPFELEGSVRNDANIDKVHWHPFDSASCPFSNLFTPEFRKNGKGPWLQGRNHTIVLIGDSLDRFHVADMCEMLGTKIVHILQGHPASPPVYLTPGANATVHKLENDLGNAPWEWTRPYLCRFSTEQGEQENVQKTYLNVINFFTYGIEDPGDMFFGSNPGQFYFPGAYIDRLDYWVKGTLSNLAKHYQETSFSAPSLVECQDGFWTLKRWSGLDKRISGQNFRPGVPSSYSSVMTDLSEERIAEYMDSLQRLIPEVVKTFDGLAAQVNATPPSMLWRTMPYTPEQNYWVPWKRAHTLYSLQQHLIKQMWHESSSNSTSEVGRLQLHKKLRIHDWNRVVAGQAFRDAVHPASNPGSVIWVQRILWELRRAVELGKGVVTNKD